MRCQQRPEAADVSQRSISSFTEAARAEIFTCNTWFMLLLHVVCRTLTLQCVARGRSASLATLAIDTTQYVACRPWALILLNCASEVRAGRHIIRSFWVVLKQTKWSIGQASGRSWSNMAVRGYTPNHSPPY